MIRGPAFQLLLLGGKCTEFWTSVSSDGSKEQANDDDRWPNPPLGPCSSLWVPRFRLRILPSKIRLTAVQTVNIMPGRLQGSTYRVRMRTLTYNRTRLPNARSVCTSDEQTTSIENTRVLYTTSRHSIYIILRAGPCGDRGSKRHAFLILELFFSLNSWVWRRGPRVCYS
jgi:hypothetical protein